MKGECILGCEVTVGVQGGFAAGEYGSQVWKEGACILQNPATSLGGTSKPLVEHASSSQAYVLFSYDSKWMRNLYGGSLLLQYIFIVQFFFKIDEIRFSLAPPPSPAHISYSVRIHN